MKTLCLILLSLLIIGCASNQTADTSPPPPSGADYAASKSTVVTADKAFQICQLARTQYIAYTGGNVIPGTDFIDTCMGYYGYKHK